MRRLRSAPVAILAILVSAGVAAAVSLPAAASAGLAIAAQHSGRTVPAVPTTTGSSLAPSADPAAAELPDAAAHGAAVAAVAQGDDPTPDTNRGADVSAAARQNHGQAVAASHKPADAGKPVDVPPADAGKPDGVPPVEVDKPADPGRPADPGPPDGVGRP
jgi:hypothetical protein